MVAQLFHQGLMMIMSMIKMMMIHNDDQSTIGYSQEKGCNRYVGWSIRAVSKLQVANGQMWLPPLAGRENVQL